jgi:GNAT superfamily N-acetyltransferase
VVGYLLRVVDGFTYRSARADDVGAMARVVADAFRGYLEFAPAGWEPPGAEVEVEHLEPLMRDPEFWCVVAERDGGVVGHSAFVPARTSRVPEADQGLVHLRALFVDRAWWGSGVAQTLHSMALEEAARRGFETIRLFTPVAHPRARRFYEREGWQSVRELPDPPLGLPLIEYRRELTR